MKVCPKSLLRYTLQVSFIDHPVAGQRGTSHLILNRSAKQLLDYPIYGGTGICDTHLRPGSPGFRTLRPYRGLVLLSNFTQLMYLSLTRSIHLLDHPYPEMATRTTLWRERDGEKLTAPIICADDVMRWCPIFSSIREASPSTTLCSSHSSLIVPTREDL